MRVNGWPWLTCSSCRGKLNDFRLFKISCIESKVAFENRFPQQSFQIFLMPENISISANASQKPNAVLLMPIAHLPASANSHIQLTPPSPFKPLTPDYNPFSTNGSSWNAHDEHHIEGNEFRGAESCKANEDPLVPKLEPAVDSVEMADGGSERMSNNDPLTADDDLSGIEETDVKYFMTKENYADSSAGCEENGITMVSMGNDEYQDGGLMNRAGAGLSNVECCSTMKEAHVVASSKKGQFVQELHSSSGEPRSGDSEHRAPPSLVFPGYSLSCGNMANASPVHTVCERCNLTPCDEGEEVVMPACDLSRDLEHISRLPICTFEPPLSKCSSNAQSNIQAAVHSGLNRECAQVVVNEGRQHVESAKETQIVPKDSSGLKRYECIMCFKLFERYEHLMSHKLSHANDPRPFKCLICPRVYSSRKNQLKHCKNHYNVPQRFECEVCNAGFRFRHYLQRHLQSHRVSNGFSCQICGQSFKSSHLRARHVAKHSGPQFPCSHCDKAFFLRAELNDHQLVHSNKKSFECNVCGKGFNKRQYLRCHRQLHDEEKRHACHECGAKFAQYASLWQHRKWHQGNKQFVCEVCSKGFVLNCQLRQHAKRHAKVPKRKGGKDDAKTVEKADGKTETDEVDGQPGVS
ncbi:zinc finger protein 519-like isoform X2 [Hetaerina americana]